MTQYEKILLETVINAGEKIIDAMTLYNSKYSWRDSWFLSVIAEEEVAKLIILPFAKFANRLDEIGNRKSVIYRHPIKQRVFTTYGVQNRENSEIEKLKQSILYVNPSIKDYSPRPVITPQQASDEIVHAVKLFDNIALTNFLASNSLSDEFKTSLKKFFESVFVPAVKSLHPAAHQAMAAKYQSPRPELTEIFKTHPLLFAELVTEALPNTYDKYFSEIEGMSLDNALKLLGKYLDRKGE